MENLELISSFLEFKEGKNIDKPTLAAILKEVFHLVLKKKYGNHDYIDVIVNADKGDLEIWKSRIIVNDGELEDEEFEIELTDARKVEPDFEVGETVPEQIQIKDLGRRTVLAIKQNLLTKLNEHDNSIVFKRYKDIVGEIVSGEVYHIRPKAIILMDDDQTELILQKNEQIPTDYFRKGDTVHAIIKNVEMRGNKLMVNLSRTAPEFLAKLFEQEIPEVFDGLISVRKVARIPGEKAKVAVDSYDDRIDPVGACVGIRGARIHGVVRELGNENIDVIQYSTNDKLFISRALNPGKVKSLEIDEENKKVEVFLEPDEVSKAIGRSGYNIRLASMLTGYQIEIFRENAIDDEDVELSEFSDEIESWILDELYRIGCDTAKSVLEHTKEDIVNRTQIEQESVDEIFKILQAEFE